MSTKAQINAQAKTSAAPAAARIPQPPVAAPEHEAERPNMAAQLEAAARLGHSLGTVGVDSSPPPIIQRQELPEEEEEELQMKPEPAAIQRQELPEEEEEELMLKPEEGRVGPQGGPVPPEVEAAIQRARGGGQPLEGAVQEQMSASLGHDFTVVRVHTDAEAEVLNRQLQAKAFTTGPDIFFKRGAYDPASSGGRELIAHELSHVVQQSSGRVNGEGSGMTVGPAGDAFEQEADEQARQVALQRAVANPILATPADILAMQRLLAQRQAEAEEDEEGSVQTKQEPRGQGNGEGLEVRLINAKLTQPRSATGVQDFSHMPVRTVQRVIDGGSGAIAGLNICNIAVRNVYDHEVPPPAAPRLESIRAALYAANTPAVVRALLPLAQPVPPAAVAGVAGRCIILFLRYNGGVNWVGSHVMIRDAGTPAGHAWGTNNAGIFGLAAAANWSQHNLGALPDAFTRQATRPAGAVVAGRYKATDYPAAASAAVRVYRVDF
jgi:hypothetical protein